MNESSLDRLVIANTTYQMLPAQELGDNYYEQKDDTTTEVKKKVLF